MIAASLRLVAALRGGAQLAGRPRSQVAHLYCGKTTPSGLVPMRGRTVCRTRTRRLSVLGLPSLEHGQRRVCRRCLPMLPAALGRDGADRLVARDQVLALYGDLTVADLTTAGRWAWTLAESHQVGFVASVVIGQPKPRQPLIRLTGERRALWLMHDAIEKRRDVLRARERTDEERAEAARRRDIEDDTRERVTTAHRDEKRRARLQDHARSGKYMTRWERAEHERLARTA